ncbi:MAG: redoxin domain-containing protein, partial [Planctomycetota bacterium]
KRDVEVVGVSVDSHYSHFAWVNTPKQSGGIEGVRYPLVADLTKSISKDYDVLLEDGSVALRGFFLIDKGGVVQHQVVNNLPLGRNVDEAIRMVDALQFFEQNGEVCPANWNKGDKSMVPTDDGLKDFFKD